VGGFPSRGRAEARCALSTDTGEGRARSCAVPLDGGASTATEPSNAAALSIAQRGEHAGVGTPHGWFTVGHRLATWRFIAFGGVAGTGRGEVR
jgi:hypothetical protein